MIKLFCLSLLLYFVKCAPKIQSSKTCYDGYTLSRNNLCVREIDENPQPICNAGELEGRGCRVQIPKIARCSEGYTMDPATKECTYTVPSDFQYFCPAGFSDSGDDCVMSTPGAITEYCEDSERIGDKCIRFMRADKIIKKDCPEGSIKEDDACWKTADSFDCSELLFKAPLNDRKDKKHRSLIGSEDFTPATPPKQFKTVVVSQGCEKRYEVPPLITQLCPENFVLDSKGCFLEEAVPMKTKCLATGGPVVECPPVIRRTSKVARCPDGTNSIKGKCVEIIKGETRKYCPPGFEEIDEMCEKIIEVTLQCPGDLVFKNGRCIGRKTHTAILVNENSAINNLSNIASPLRIPFKEPRSMKLLK